MKSNAEAGAAAFFDLDKTIISVFSEQALGAHLLRKGALAFHKVLLIGLGYVVYSLVTIRDYEKLKKMAVGIVMRGQSTEKAERLYDSFFDQTLKHKIYPAIAAEIEKHRQEGRKLVLISSSIDLIVSRFAAFLKFDRFYAAHLETAQGRYTGRVLGRVFNGSRKVEAVREFAAEQRIDLAASYAYGDYADDQHMLSLVGHPVAVNPDEKLRRIAQERQWKIWDMEPFPHRKAQ